MHTLKELTHSSLFLDLPQSSKDKVLSAFSFFTTSHEVAHTGAVTDTDITNLQLRFHLLGHFKEIILNTLALDAFPDGTREKQWYDHFLSIVENLRSSLGQTLSASGAAPLSLDEAEQTIIAGLRYIVNRHVAGTEQ